MNEKITIRNSRCQCHGVSTWTVTDPYTGETFTSTTFALAMYAANIRAIAKTRGPDPTFEFLTRTRQEREQLLIREAARSKQLRDRVIQVEVDRAVAHFETDGTAHVDGTA